MAIPALTVPITADDAALQAAFARAKAAVSNFSASGTGDLDALDRRMAAMAGNLREKLDFSQVLGRSGKSAKDSAAAFEELLQEQNAVARSVAALRAQIDPLGAAQLKLNAALAEHGKLAAIGAISTTEQAAANGLAQKAFADSERAVATHTKAVNEHTKSTGLSNVQALEGVHIVKSLADEFAAGASPLRAFSLEGGRIAQFFSAGPGGVLGTLSAVGGVVTSLLSPLVLGAAAVVGFGAAALYAASSYRTMQGELAKSLSGVGHATGLSTEGLNNLAVASSAQTGVGIGDARSNAETLAATGKFDPSTISGVLGLTRGYAAAYGTSTSEAGQKLADIFSDPIKGADQLNERLGFLDDRTRQYIKSLQAQGNQQGAVRALIEASSTSINEQTQKLGFWEQKWNDIKNAGGAVVNAVGAATAPATPLERYREAQRGANFYRPLLQNPLVPVVSPRPDDSSNAAEDLRHAGMLAGASPIMRSQQDDLIASRQSREGADVVRSVLPEIGQRQDLIDQQKKLSDAIGNPDALKLMGVSAEQANQAVSQLTNKLAVLGTPLSRLAQDGDLAARSAQARTAAEKAAVDADRAFIEAMRQTGSELQAAQAAENARTQAIAAGTREALDSLKTAQGEASLVGLSPFDRMIQENRLHAQDLYDRTVVGPAAAPTNGASGAAASIDRTMGFEGGLNPHDTNGTASNYGINQAAFPGLDVTKLTPDQAAALYKKNYWDKTVTPEMSPALAHVAFDTSVMEGPNQAAKLIAASGSNPNTLLDLRQNFEAGLLAKNPAKYGPYAQSWANRDAGLRSDIGGSPPLSPAVASMAVTADRQSRDLTGAENLLFPGVNQANEQIQGQLALAKIQSTGSSPSALAKATEAQTEWNKVASDGVTLQKLQNQFGAQGTQMWSDLSSKITANATAVGQLNKVQQTNQKTVGALDGVRGFSGDLIGGVIKAAAHGTSPTDAVRSALLAVLDKSIDQGANGITAGLFGNSGSAGGGLLGGGIGSLFSSLFGGNVAAGWMPTSFGFANGGIMTSAGPVPLRKYASGGIANAPQLAMFGEGSSNEAFVPLPDGRSIPVSMKTVQPKATATVSTEHHYNTINFNVTSPDAPSFARSESQMSTLLARTVARGQRNQ